MGHLHTARELNNVLIYECVYIKETFFNDMAAILNSIVSNSYYGMFRGQIHTNLPPEPGKKVYCYPDVINGIIIFLAAYYLKYLKTPYFIFVRDALSYLALVVLHYAFCLAPSSLAFSGLEWSILIFFMGRSLVEYRQIRLTVNRIKERRKSGKDETNSNVLQKALCSYIR